MPCCGLAVVAHRPIHYDDVIMTMLASQITSLLVVYSIVYSGVNQRKHQSSASLAFVREIHRGPVNFPHKWPVTRKMFPFDYVIMFTTNYSTTFSRPSASDIISKKCIRQTWIHQKLYRKNPGKIGAYFDGIYCMFLNIIQKFPSSIACDFPPSWPIIISR